MSTTTTITYSRFGVKTSDSFHRTILNEYEKRPNPEEHYKEKFIGQFFEEKYTEAEKYKSAFFELTNQFEKLKSAKNESASEKKKPNIWKWLFFIVLGAVALIFTVNSAGNSKK